MVGLAVHLYLNIRQERKEIEVRDLNIFSLKKKIPGGDRRSASLI